MLSKKTRKIVFSILAVLQIFALNAPFVFAQGPVYLIPGKAGNLGTDMGPNLGTSAGPNLGTSMSESFATGAAATLEERYNLNLASMQDQGQNFNVSSQKMLGPQVMLSFNPLAPKPNEEITATAAPMYFGNDPKNMYFTWYIKHAGCDLGINGLNLPGLSEEKKSIKTRCDADGNGRITVNDWKVDAMRRIAGNEFNWKEALEANPSKYRLGNPKQDGTWPPNKTEQNKDEDSRGDGYYAYFGGEDQKALEKKFDLGNLSGDAKDFICNLLVLTENPNLDEDSDRAKRRDDLSEKLECNASVPTETLTDEDYAKACIKDRACIERLDQTIPITTPLTTQELASGCSNNIGAFDLDSDGNLTDDSYNDANGPEGDCYTAAGASPSLSALATACSADSGDIASNSAYSDASCIATALLIKNYPAGVYSSYLNYYTNACNSVGEEDCGNAAVDTYSSVFADACRNDSTCPLTALALMLNSTAGGQTTLANACKDTSISSSCNDTVTQKANATNKFKAFIEISKDIAGGAEGVVDFLKEYPDFAQELENFSKQIEDGVKKFKKNVNNINLSDLTWRGVLGYFLDFENWDEIAEFVELMTNFLDSITDMLTRLMGSKSHCYVHDFATGIDYEIGNRCDQSLHLFGQASGIQGLNRVGNGIYGPLEERFWHTNPEDVSTADNGQVDEANVVGLGQDEFTWTFQPGDQVGVAVEGVSILASKYDDASQKVMWALPRNIFDDGDCAIDKDGVIEEMIKGYKVKIPKAKVDLDKCLEPNLIDPTSGGQAEKISIALSYSPKNPINNSLPTTEENDKKKSDTLEVQASITSANVTDLSLANFTWSVSYSTADNASTDEWTTVPVEVMKKLTTQNVGKGLERFKLSLNLKKEDLDNVDSDEEINFLKVSVNVKDSAYGSISHEGTKTIIVPLFSTSNQIFVYPVTVDNATDPAKSFINLVPDSVYNPLTDPEACITGSCLVMKNDIIGLKFIDTNNYSNFSWLIDNIPFLPIDGCGENCATNDPDKNTFGANTNIAYFPITKNVGQNHVVTLNADGKNGKKLTLTKVFTVIDPKVKLFAEDLVKTTANTSSLTSPVLRGNYVEPDQTRTPDFDYGTFETSENNQVIIAATPNFVQNNLALKDFTWTINGGIEIMEDDYGITSINETGIPTDASGQLVFPAEIATLLLDNGIKDLKITSPDSTDPGRKHTLTFTTTKKISDAYTFSSRAVYAQPNDVKLALQRNWGITLGSFYEKDVDDTIALNIEDIKDVVAQKNSPKNIATIFSGFPTYFSFLLKLTLAIMLILFSSWLIISFPFKKNEF